MPMFNNEEKTITFDVSELAIRDTSEGDEVLQVSGAFNTSIIERARELGVQKVIKQEEQE